MRIAAGAAVSVALLVWLARSVDLPELGHQLAATRWWWVVPAVAVGPVGVWARALRWRYLFPPGSAPTGLVAANMIGYMANNILPLRGGEIVRVYVAARHLRLERGMSTTQSLWLAGAAAVVERLLDSLSLVLIMTVLIFMIPVPPALQYAAAIIFALNMAAAGVLLVLILAPGPSRRWLARLMGRWPRVATRGERGLDMVLLGLSGVRARAHLVPVLAWTVFVWVLGAVGAWTLLRAVHLDLSLTAGWTVMTFVGFGISIPSAPGFVGVWHAAAVLALAIFGVAQATALGYAVLFHASQFVPITLLGWIFLVREHVSLGEATRASIATGGAGPPDLAAPGSG